MRLEFVLCTTLTFMQMLDVCTAQDKVKGSGNSSKNTEVNKTRPTQTKTPPPQSNPKSSSSSPKPNEQKTLNPEPAVPRVTARGLEDRNEIINPDDEMSESNNSPELELPTANIINSAKMLGQTVTRQASKGGGGFLNSLTRIVQSTANTFSFFSNIARNHVSNTNNLIKYTGDTISKTGNAAYKGTINTIKSAKSIGRDGEKQFYKVLDETEGLGKQLMRLGGNTASTSISIVSKLAKLGSGVILSTKRSSDRLFDSIIPIFPENEDENDNDNETNAEEKEESTVEPEKNQIKTKPSKPGTTKK